MKILLANALYIPNIGGVENYIRSLAKVLTEAGHTVEVVASDRVPIGALRPPAEENSDEADIYRYHYRGGLLSYPMSMLRAWWLVRKRCQAQHGFDRVLVRSHHAVIFCWLARVKNLVYVAPGVYSYQYKHSKNWRKPGRLAGYWLNVCLQRLAFAVSDDVVVLSWAMVEQVSRFTNGAIQAHVVPPGVDQSRFFPRDEQEKKVLRSQLKLPIEGRVILGLGRFTQVKGFEYAIEALAYLPRDFQLVLVGEGPEHAYYNSIACQFSVSDRLQIIPATTSPELYFGAADAYVLSSTHETFGQVLLEATASGLPIAAFSKDAGVLTATEELYQEFPELIRWANEKSGKALATAIVQSLSQRLDTTEEKGGWEKFSNRYSWHGVAERLLNLAAPFEQEERK